MIRLPALLLVPFLLGAQFGYPTTDDQDGGWQTTSTPSAAVACSATDCTTEIDEGEGTPSATGTKNEADWIESKEMSSADSDTYEANMTSLDEPATTTGIVRYSDFKVETGGGANSVCETQAYVYEGTTLRASCSSYAVTKNVWTDRACTGLDLSGVTDWSDVEVRVVATYVSGGKTCLVRVSWIELEIADAESAGRTRRTF